MYPKLANKACVFFSCFLFFSLPAMCQFKLLWSQKIQGATDQFTPGDITGISRLNHGYAILFSTARTGHSETMNYPTLGYLDDSDVLWRGIRFEDSVWNRLYLIGASQANDSTLFLFGNDYTKRSDTLPNPAPYQISVVMRNKAFVINDYFAPQLSDVQHVKAMDINSYCGDGKKNSYLSIIRRENGVADRAMLFAVNGNITGNAQFEDVSHIDLPFADSSSVVAVTQTKLDNGQRSYIQIHVLDNNLQPIVTYPDDTKENIASRMPGKGSERLVNLNYRPAYHVGFVTREVITKEGKKRVAWYAFNGQQGKNWAMGNDNIITVNGYVIPANEEVIADGDLNTGGSATNRMIVSVDRKGGLFSGSGDDLVFSIGDYMGVESSRYVIKDCIDPYMNEVRGWSDGKNHLYVVANLTSTVTNEKPGLYIMKWEATDEAIKRTLDKAPATYGWSSKPFYSQDTIPANDSHDYTLLGIDSSDANFALNSTLKDKKIKLQSPLIPVGNTYWFSGTVKIDRKEYVFTKVAVARVE